MTWRFMKDEDQEATKVLHSQLEKRLGRTMDRPDPMSRPVIAAVVKEENGVITQGLYLEAEVEVCAMGTGVLAPAEMAEAVEMLTQVAKEYKIRIARSFVPTIMLPPDKRGRKPAMERLLKKVGFTRERGKIAQFFKWL